MKNKLADQFLKVANAVSSIERARNPVLRKKELWLQQLFKGMDQVLNSKTSRALNAK